MAGTSVEERTHRPLFFDDDLGWVPHDEEFPRLADGGHVIVHDWDRGDASGAVERGERFERVFGSDPRPGLVRLAPRPAAATMGPAPAQWRERLPEPAFENDATVVALALVLHDPGPEAPIPPLRWTTALLEHHGVGDHVGAVRRERMARRVAACEELAAPLRRLLDEVGGAVVAVQREPQCVLRCRVPVGAVAQVVAHPGVAWAERDAEEGQPDALTPPKFLFDRETGTDGDAVSDNGYGCTTGRMYDRYDGTVDSPWGGCDNTYLEAHQGLSDMVLADSGCAHGCNAFRLLSAEEAAEEMPYVYQDVRMRAVGLSQYVEAGYTGTGRQGLAYWAVADDAWTDPETRIAMASAVAPHVGVGIVDAKDNIRPFHVAFDAADGTSRIRAFINGDGVGTPSSTGWDEAAFAQLTGVYSHGTSVAGFAMGSVVAGQDSRLEDTASREARSGIARTTKGVFVEGLAHYRDHYTRVDADPVWPVDVLGCSVTYNSGGGLEGNSYACPTDDEARGSTACPKASSACGTMASS